MYKSKENIFTTKLKGFTHRLEHSCEFPVDRQNRSSAMRMMVDAIDYPELDEHALNIIKNSPAWTGSSLQTNSKNDISTNQLRNFFKTSNIFSIEQNL